MAFRQRLLQHALVLLALPLLIGCAKARPEAQAASPTRSIPTLYPTINTPPPSATPINDTGWQEGSHGIALRQMRIVGEPGRPAFPLTVVRIDLGQARLRVAYAPEQPRALRSWFEQLQPLAIINGGFFLENYQATALVISDGQPNGASYDGFGGMLSVGSDGAVRLRALRDQPYDPSEPISQALQSFPMLVFPGGTPASISDNGARARRSAVALDRDGRLLLIASSTSDFTLNGFAAWLSQSDLNIDSALNLDGGPSTGLFLKSGGQSAQIDSFGPLPQVLLVEAR